MFYVLFYNFFFFFFFFFFFHSYFPCIIHPASRGVAAHTAVVLRHFQGPERGSEACGHRSSVLFAGGIIWYPGPQELV